MTRLFTAALVSVSLFACGSSPTPIEPPRPLLPTPSPPAPTASVTAAPASLPRPAARIGEPLDGRFALAVDCGAYEYRVGPIGKGLLGVCGASLQESTVFHVPGTGAARLAPDVFKGLSPRTGTPGATLGITWIRGTDLEHFEADVTELRTRTGFSWTYRKTGKAWKTVGLEAFNGDNFGLPSALLGKRELLQAHGEDGVVRFAYADRKPGWIPAAAKVDGCAEPVSGFSLLKVVGKDLWGMGVACEKLVAQRWTIGEEDTSLVPLDLPGVPFQGSYTDLEGTGIYVGGAGRSVARFDGRTWESLGELPSPALGNSPFLAGGRLYLPIEPKLFRLAGKRFEEVVLPDEGANQVIYSEKGEIRIVTDKGVYALGPEDVFRPVAIPVPAKEVESLRQVGERWVFIRRAGDASRVHLYVEGASGPPLAITAPAGVLSVFTYVQPLHGYCEKPFALLYKLARTAPANYDFPATRDALRGHADLAAGRFSEVAAFGERYLIARYEGPKARPRLSALSALVQAKVAGSKPQLLCADRVEGELPTVRDVPMK